jgi:stalled ribosome alternative rescue factor ArfA
MEEFRKREEKKRKKKGVWPKANDPYPWEKDK